MALRLNGSSSGYVELDVPAAAGSHTLTLPDGGGSNGQYLQTDGSGGLSWQTVTVPDAVACALIADVKTSGTHGGTFTQGDWRTRDLNNFYDPGNIGLTVASNQFTLPAGTYLINWTCPAFTVNSHQTRLFNVTSSSAGRVGSNEFSWSGTNIQTNSIGWDIVFPTVNTTYRIEHRCDTTVTTNGFGRVMNFGEEKYTQVVIWSLA